MNGLWEEFIQRSTIAAVSIATGALIVIADQWAMQGQEGRTPWQCVSVGTFGCSTDWLSHARVALVPGQWVGRVPHQ